MGQSPFLLRLGVAVCIAFFIPHVQPAAPAAFTMQQQPELPPLQQTPAIQSHKIKVWTNEDLIALRTPADIYILEKEAQAADSEAKALMACFAWALPAGTMEETQKAIQHLLQSIHDSEDAIAQVRKELDEAPESLRARNQKELERREAELEASREQLNALQEHLHDLAKQPAGKNPIVPATLAP